MLSFAHHLELQSGNAQFVSKSSIFFFGPCDFEIWRLTLKNNRAPLLCYFKFFYPVRPWNLPDDLENYRAPLLTYLKLCASFRSHRWIQAGVTVPCDLEILRMTMKNNKAPLLCYFKFCAWFRSHLWILELRSGKDQIGTNFVLTIVTLTFDLWPWHLAWTSLLSMVITRENFIMMRWIMH